MIFSPLSAVRISWISLTPCESSHTKPHPNPLLTGEGIETVGQYMSSTSPESTRSILSAKYIFPPRKNQVFVKIW